MKEKKLLKRNFFVKILKLTKELEEAKSSFHILLIIDNMESELDKYVEQVSNNS